MTKEEIIKEIRKDIYYAEIDDERIVKIAGNILKLTQPQPTQSAEEFFDKSINEADLNFIFHEKKKLYCEIVNAMEQYAKSTSAKNAQVGMSAKDFLDKWIDDGKSIETAKNVCEFAEQYAEQAQETVYEIYSKPFRELEPLDKIWQDETGNKGIYPDITQLIKWAVNKIKSYANQKQVSVSNDKIIHKAYESAKKDLKFNGLIYPSAYLEGFKKGAKWMRNKMKGE